MSFSYCLFSIFVIVSLFLIYLSDESPYFICPINKIFLNVYSERIFVYKLIMYNCGSMLYTLENNVKRNPRVNNMFILENLLTIYCYTIDINPYSKYSW
jgi:hypothetical protein